MHAARATLALCALGLVLAARAAPAEHANSGRCRLLDLRFLEPADYGEQLGQATFRCSAEELACFLEGQVLFEGGCHRLLERGPCGDGHWLVLESAPLAEGRVAPACRPRPCGPGHVALKTDPRCRPLNEVRSTACGGQRVLEDAFGEARCAAQYARRQRRNAQQ